MQLHRRPRLVLDRFFLVLLAMALSGCVVRGGRGGGGGGGGGDDDDSVPTNETTDQLRLELLDVLMLDWGICTPGNVEMACAWYEIAFELVHDGDDVLVALDELTVSGGDMEFTNRESCSETPWVIDAGVALQGEISVQYEGEQGLPTMYHRCGNSTMLFTSPVPGDAPKGGDVTVEARIIGEEFVHRVEGTSPIQFGGMR